MNITNTIEIFVSISCLFGSDCSIAACVWSVNWVYGLFVGGSASVGAVLAVSPSALVGPYQRLSGRLSVYKVWRGSSVTEIVVKKRIPQL